MCRIYNTIGSLTSLKSHLTNCNIHDFKSLKEVMNFQSSYNAIREQIISNHENLIEQEKNMLSMDLQQLDIQIETEKQQSEQRLTDELNNLKQQLNALTTYTPNNIFQKITKVLKIWKQKRKLTYKEDNFKNEVQISISNLFESYQIKQNRFQFISSKTKEAVIQSAQAHLSELERKKVTIDEVNSYIYGALGEQKVVKTLENLSDDYFLINDFSISFHPPIYNRQEDDYISSIQIDHILVGPSGVFLIETKNWSEKSLENLSLRSPVLQIKRTSLALFKLLNNEISNYNLSLNMHHWGDRKITIRNLIAMTHTKPKEEFQYVKILTVNELIGYVNYFKPIFTNDETQKIAEFLIDINNSKLITTIN